MGWGESFFFKFSFRLDSLIPLWLQVQNLPSVIKKKPNGVTYCKRAFPHQVQAHAEVPEHVSACYYHLKQFVLLVYGVG